VRSRSTSSCSRGGGADTTRRRDGAESVAIGSPNVTSLSSPSRQIEHCSIVACAGARTGARTADEEPEFKGGSQSKRRSELCPESYFKLSRGDSGRPRDRTSGVVTHQPVSRVRRTRPCSRSRGKKAARIPGLFCLLVTYRPLAFDPDRSKPAAKPARYKLQVDYEQNKTPSRGLRRPHARPLGRRPLSHVGHALII
jgi:hypothetical protein